MRLAPYLPPLVFYYSCQTLANVEKTIFLAPEGIEVAQQQHIIGDLNLDALTPKAPILRRDISAAFPSSDSPRGLDAWILLDDLTEGHRYEVRLCWAATVRVATNSCTIEKSKFRVVDRGDGKFAKLLQQPTAFILNEFTLSEVFSDPKLLSSLTSYSVSQRSAALRLRPETETTSNDLASVLLLRILATADYFTTNETLMHSVPRVNVEIGSNFSPVNARSNS